MTPLVAIIRSSISSPRAVLERLLEVADLLAGEDGARLDGLEVEGAALVSQGAQLLRGGILPAQALLEAGDCAASGAGGGAAPSSHAETASYASLARLRTIAR